ncbi:MAG: hypothetical protein LW707_09555 [Sphingobacteriales bacterium]|nr:hypothetical protein [Sphingobacteriales bacterium]
MIAGGFGKGCFHGIVRVFNEEWFEVVVKKATPMRIYAMAFVANGVWIMVRTIVIAHHGHLKSLTKKSALFLTVMCMHNSPVFIRQADFILGQPIKKFGISIRLFWAVEALGIMLFFHQLKNGPWNC